MSYSKFKIQYSSSLIEIGLKRGSDVRARLIYSNSYKIQVELAKMRWGGEMYLLIRGTSENSADEKI